MMANGIRVVGPMTSEYAEILTPEALAFVERLHRELTRGGRSCCACGRSGRRRSWPGARSTSCRRRAMCAKVSGPSPPPRPT